MKGKKASYPVALYYKSFFSFIGFCFLLLLKTGAQPLSFHHVNTSDGLSENNVRSVAIDKNGYLWIGTMDGLNVYDGYAVTSFKKETTPDMASNDVIHLTCDSKNRIWLGTPEGITWVDENRKFHRVVLNDSVIKIWQPGPLWIPKRMALFYTPAWVNFFSMKKRINGKDWIGYRIT